MTDEGTGRCSPETLKLVADYWVLRIIEELNAAGSLRFLALQRALGGASPATLSQRLKALEDAELVVRAEGDAAKASVSYSLSERGLRVLPVIRAINEVAVELA